MVVVGADNQHLLQVLVGQDILLGTLVAQAKAEQVVVVEH